MPAASSPSIRIRISLLPNTLERILPILADSNCHTSPHTSHLELKHKFDQRLCTTFGTSTSKQSAKTSTTSWVFLLLRVSFLDLLKIARSNDSLAVKIRYLLVCQERSLCRRDRDWKLSVGRRGAQCPVTCSDAGGKIIRVTILES